MRFRIPFMAGVVALIALLSTSTGWTETLEEIKAEMGAKFIPGMNSLDMRVPVVMSGMTGMLVTELCASGGSLHPKDPSKASMDFGKVPPDNQFPVNVNLRIKSETGDHIYMYQRMLEVPACK